MTAAGGSRSSTGPAASRGGAAPTIRARVRAEMTEEIKAVARRHLAAEGANLSLRAVARDMGMVSSALYRYFASRDELLTALIIDGYNSMADAADRADAAVADRADGLARWLAVGHALRDWAMAQPSEYALLYGSPVPGYAAPVDTVEPASRPVVVLADILTQAHAGGRLSPPALSPPALSPLGLSSPAASSPALSPSPSLPARLRAELKVVAEAVGARAPEVALAHALVAWTELFGAISFELFGRLNNTIDERRLWYDYQLRTMAALMGLS